MSDYSYVPPPIGVVYQPELLRGASQRERIEALGHPCFEFKATGAWRSDLDTLEREISGQSLRPVVFVSLQAAGHIRRNCPTLARGLILPKSFLTHHRYHGLISPDLLLNPLGVYLPWAQIAKVAPKLPFLAQSDIFIRPDSPLKPFTGCVLPGHDLDKALSVEAASQGIAPEELCFVAPARPDMPRYEYRCWMIEGLPVTAASYSWRSGLPAGPVPREIIEAAIKIGESLLYHETAYTADFAIVDDGPKLVELNAISTSGWYGGLDIAALIQALDPILV